MRVRFLIVLSVIALTLAGSARPVQAQSLADVARKEAERRKAVKDAGKIITNTDLPAGQATASGGAAKPATALDTPQPPKASGADDKAKADAGKADAKDEKYWKDRMKALQAAVDRDQTFADALQTQINSLTNDFVNRDDPAQRAVIANNKQKALDELARLKQTLADDKKAITDLEEEARKAGVPPGWLR